MKKRATFASAMKAIDNSSDHGSKRSYPELWVGDGADLTAFLGMADLSRA